MAEGKRFMLRLQPSTVRALKEAGQVTGIGDVQAMIYHCINLGLQQVTLIVGQRQQTSVLETMIQAVEKLPETGAGSARIEAVGGPVTPPHSAQTGTPSGYSGRRIRKAARHA